jgi:hypothetical protein
MDERHELMKIATFAAAYEADFAVERLRAAGITAFARGNDIVGIFGPGFQGPTARGVDVFVPPHAAAAARDVLDAEVEIGDAWMNDAEEGG